jgi:hypothetical protein
MVRSLPLSLNEFVLWVFNINFLKIFILKRKKTDTIGIEPMTLR